MSLEEIDAYHRENLTKTPPPLPTDDQIVALRRLFGVDDVKPRRPSMRPS